MNQDMLDQLNAIPWASFKAAGQNPYYDIPRELLGLINAKGEEAAERAYWNLEHAVHKAGDWDESAFYIVPFLIKLANDRSLLSRTRRDAVALLAFIAYGNQPDDIWVNLQSGPITLNVPLKVACRCAVGCGLPHYLEFLAESDLAVKKCTLGLLEPLYEYVLIILPVLEQHLKTETDGAVIQALQQAITELKVVWPG